MPLRLAPVRVGGLSGVALNIELDPLLKKIQRKRLIRDAAAMILAPNGMSSPLRPSG